MGEHVGASPLGGAQAAVIGSERLPRVHALAAAPARRRFSVAVSTSEVGHEPATVSIMINSVSALVTTAASFFVLNCMFVALVALHGNLAAVESITDALRSGHGHTPYIR